MGTTKRVIEKNKEGGKVEARKKLNIERWNDAWLLVIHGVVFPHIKFIEKKI